MSSLVLTLLAMVLAGVVLLLPHLAWAESPPPELKNLGAVIEVQRDEQLAFGIDGVKKLSIADPRVADVKVIDGVLKVRGLEEGETQIITWQKNGGRRSFVAVEMESVRKATWLSRCVSPWRMAAPRRR